MAFKFKEEHLLSMIDFMNLNKELATGRLSSANAREAFRKKWNELTLKLNSLGLGERSVEKWQKTWRDYKCNLKKKASEIKKYQSGTGGGPECSKKLTDLEMRVLEILGHTFYGGCGTEEHGLEHISELITTQVDHSVTSTSSTTHTQAHKKRNVDFRDKNGDITDHDYLFFKENQKQQPTKKMKSNNCDDLYRETISNLKSIGNTLKKGLSDLNNTLDKKLTEITCAILRNSGNYQLTDLEDS